MVWFFLFYLTTGAVQFGPFPSQMDCFDKQMLLLDHYNKTKNPVVAVQACWEVRVY